VLLAESFSGPIALRLLAKYPGRFQAAVLCATFARSPFVSFLGMRTLVMKGLFGNATLENILLRKFCSGQDIPPDIQQMIHKISEQIPPEIIKKRLQIMDTADTRSLLPRISAPVLYLAGLQDKLVPAELRAELFENIPRICFKGIDGPHLLLQTQGGICATTIMNFLDLEEIV
jgi:pimeloyl-ACP methyl ester carboxylesterase